MKSILPSLLLLLLLPSCDNPKELSSVNPNNWSKRASITHSEEGLEHGTTYLSVYSQIYSRTEHGTHDLTVTVSMRNVSESDTIFVKRATYYDTHGNTIRNYFPHAIYIAPLETVEIVIDEKNQEGGTGGNFLFDWSTPLSCPEPIFESVMISTSGQQGLSFAMAGKRVR